MCLWVLKEVGGAAEPVLSAPVLMRATALAVLNMTSDSIKRCHTCAAVEVPTSISRMIETCNVPVSVKQRLLPTSLRSPASFAAYAAIMK